MSNTLEKPKPVGNANLTASIVVRMSDLFLQCNYSNKFHMIFLAMLRISKNEPKGYCFLEV